MSQSQAQAQISAASTLMDISQQTCAAYTLMDMSQQTSQRAPSGYSQAETELLSTIHNDASASLKALEDFDRMWTMYVNNKVDWPMDFSLYTSFTKAYTQWCVPSDGLMKRLIQPFETRSGTMQARIKVPVHLDTAVTDALKDTNEALQRMSELTDPSEHNLQGSAHMNNSKSETIDLAQFARDFMRNKDILDRLQLVILTFMTDLPVISDSTTMIRSMTW